MLKTAVIYRSKYGYAKTYAEWIAAALGADLLDSPNPRRLDRYDVLVFGGGLYAGGIGGSKLLTTGFDRWRDKHLVLFTVGLSPTADPATFRPIIERTFSPEMREKIRFFHFRGGIDYARLGFVHRSMMCALKTALKTKPNRSHQENLILESYGARVDFRDKQTIAPLVEYIRDLEGGGAP